MNSNNKSFDLEILKTFDRALKFSEKKKYLEAYIEFLNCINLISTFLEKSHSFTNPKFNVKQLFQIFKMCLNRVEVLYPKIPKESIEKVFENSNSQNRTNLYSTMIQTPSIQVTNQQQLQQQYGNNRRKSTPTSNTQGGRGGGGVLSHQMGSNSPTQVYPSPMGEGQNLSIFSPNHPTRPKSWSSPHSVLGGGGGVQQQYHQQQQQQPVGGRLYNPESGKFDDVYKFVIPPPPVSNSEMQVYKKRFRTLDTSNDHRVSKHEFAIGLGLLGINPFSDTIFPGFLGSSKAKNQEESFDLKQFERSLYVLYHGSKEEKFSFSSTLFDPLGLDYISEDVFGASFRRAFQLVEYLKSENLFDENNKRNVEMTSKVVWGLFKKFGGNGRGIIPKEHFLKHSGSLFFRELGLRDQQGTSNNNTINNQTPSLSPNQQNRHKMPVRTFRNRIGSPTCFGDKHFNLVLQMMTGISITVDMFSRKNKCSLRDFSSTIKFDLPNAPWDRLKTIQFVAHCPLVFKKIRRMTGVCISEKEFRHSFGIEQVIGSLMSGTLSTLTSTVSAGKSGNFFFSTYNGVFICKTISHGEVEHLLSTLQSYVDHLEERENSLLTRIIGLYTLQDSTTTSGKTTERHFIVMNNVFQTSNKMDVIYDLKGSTFGRTNTSGDGPKKDLDLTNTGEVVRIGEAMKNNVLDILHSDSEFLRKNNIIDYSLLLGIHFVKQNSQQQQQQQQQINNNVKNCGRNSQQQQQQQLDEFGLPISGGYTVEYVRSDGGIMSVGGDKIYYMGVIDHLIHYGFKKNMESVVKRFWYGKEEEISVVEPDQYSKRFVAFMEKVFV